ncbi:uncharacterized protein C15orf39 homolog [Megalops cyprinoides]|uniref:uncharacterized protein C15orf39 homolog n=1 Tax=Megalops cyprinoides TaxID=118141 RepID=UPI001864F9F6|nr:uncharacterized protein C15orf39 homolog [Megalops cyprinoides]XP_036400287.1 uncharacterized protein C15orf39 homolog [Megalops cyprinoides]
MVTKQEIMSSKQTQGLESQAAPCKMPYLERTVGNVAHARLHYPDGLPKYSSGEPVSYRGAFLSYCLSGKGRTHPWSPSNSCLQTSRGPVICSTNAKSPFTQQILCRQGKPAFSVEGGPSLTAQEATVTQKLGNCDESPGRGSAGRPGVHAPVAVRKLGIGGTGVSSEGAARLAIPKPVYGVRQCYAPGSCYSTELGLSGTHLSTCKDEWMLRYGSVSLLQTPGSDSAVRQSGPQLGQAGGKCALKELSLEGQHTLGPPGPRMFPVLAEQNYHRVPNGRPAQSFLSPPSKQNLHLQFPSKTLQGQPPSYTYEEMQRMALSLSGFHPRIHFPPVSQCAPLPQRPTFHYPIRNVGMENIEVNKDKGGKRFPTANNQSSQNPLGQHPMDQASFSEAAIPRPAAPEAYPFHTSYDLSPCHMYKVDQSIGKKRTFSEGPGSSLLVQSADQFVDQCMQRLQDPSLPREICGRPRSPGAFHPVRPCFTYKGLHHMPVEHQPFKMLPDLRSGDNLATDKEAAPCCIADPPLGGAGPYMRQRVAKRISALHAKALANKKQDIHSSQDLNAHKSPAQRQVEDSADLHEVSNKKEGEKESNQEPPERQEPPSPPMPVINNVFSLAPYKAYLEMSGILPLQNVSQTGELKTEPDSHSHERDSEHNSDESTHGLKLSLPFHEKDSVIVQEPQGVKREETALQFSSCSVKSVESETEWQHQGLGETEVKTEDGDVVKSSSEGALDLSVKKKDFGESPREAQPSPRSHSAYSLVRRGEVSVHTPHCFKKQTVLSPTLPPPPPPPHPETPQIICLQQLSPEHLQPSANRIHLVGPFWSALPSTQTAPSRPEEAKPSTDSLRQARHRFMELHQLLSSLISRSVDSTPEQDLRDWLAKSKERDSASPAAKTQDVPREAWLKSEDTAAALGRVVNRLECCVSAQDWPFPHVLRAGAVFVPILLVKETLFPQVPGPLIDRVLQEHRVELRPATLSEERHLVQLQRRACSSKLRKLLSLKHLPDIYPDVLGLFYRTCVSKRLGVELDIPLKRVENATEGSNSKTHSQSAATRPCLPDPPEPTKDPKTQPPFKKQRRRGKKKRDLKRMFSATEEVPGDDCLGNAEKSGNWSTVSSLGQKTERTQSSHTPEEDDEEEEEEDSMKVPQEGAEEPENTCGGSVTSRDLSSGNSKAETDNASTASNLSQSLATNRPQSTPSSSCGRILKVPKVLNPAPTMRNACPQPGTCPERQPGGRGISGKMRLRSTQRRRGGIGFSRALRPSGSPRLLHLRRSAMQTKQWPGRRSIRWALRSAARTSGTAWRNGYPELVGKTIRHLYEEKDKSEVWYRGVVVRVHEPHSDPLKTVFEVKYDNEPEWQYYLELLVDYKKGWLTVED